MQWNMLITWTISPLFRKLWLRASKNKSGWIKIICFPWWVLSSWVSVVHIPWNPVFVFPNLSYINLSLFAWLCPVTIMWAVVSFLYLPGQVKMPWSSILKCDDHIYHTIKALLLHIKQEAHTRPHSLQFYYSTCKKKRRRSYASIYNSSLRDNSIILHSKQPTRHTDVQYSGGQYKNAHDFFKWRCISIYSRHQSADHLWAVTVMTTQVLLGVLQDPSKRSCRLGQDRKCVTKVTAWWRSSISSSGSDSTTDVKLWVNCSILHREQRVLVMWSSSRPACHLDRNSPVDVVSRQLGFVPGALVYC